MAYRRLHIGQNRKWNYNSNMATVRFPK